MNAFPNDNLNSGMIRIQSGDSQQDSEAKNLIADLD